MVIDINTVSNEPSKRNVWVFKRAKWQPLKTEFAGLHWAELFGDDFSANAATLADLIFDVREDTYSCERNCLPDALAPLADRQRHYSYRGEDANMLIRKIRCKCRRMREGSRWNIFCTCGEIAVNPCYIAPLFEDMVEDEPGAFEQ